MKLALLRTTVALALAHATPALADDAALQLVVRGPDVDRAALHAELERELARPIAPAERCDAACLDVTLADGTAVVVYTPASGAPRLRTLPLDGDARTWPTLVALLAGNLVRDEAGDVLAELPVLPPASASSEPPPVIDERRELLAPVAAPAERAPGAAHEGTFAFGFVPFVSTDLHRVGRVRHWVSIDLVAGVSGGSRGLTLAGVADVERGTVAGTQLAGVAAVAERVGGLQIGGVAAVSGELTGVQLAGAAAIADRAHGTQIAGAVAIARHSAGTQIAGSTAVARTAHVQIAGAVTVAERVRGLQLAPINIARHVDGVQLGVINVGGSADGISLGLVNIVPGGRTDVEASVDSNALGTVMLRHGSRRWHNVYGVGGKRIGDAMLALEDGDDVWMYGLGFGPSWRRGGTLVDLDAICWQVNHGGHNDRLSLLNQARLSVAHDLGAVTVVAGGALNVYVSTDRASPLYTERRAPGAEMDTGVTVSVWPSAFVGVRL